MRIQNGLVWVALAGWLAGCATSKPSSNVPPPSKQAPSQKTYITPDFRTVGRVELVNTAARFVILSFAPGHVPPPGQHWQITHRGLKIGEVTISGPQREVDTVADIVDGTANVGDDATAE
jgi:hypothetical protein